MKKEVQTVHEIRNAYDKTCNKVRDLEHQYSKMYKRLQLRRQHLHDNHEGRPQHVALNAKLEELRALIDEKENELARAQHYCGVSKLMHKRAQNDLKGPDELLVNNLQDQIHACKLETKGAKLTLRHAKQEQKSAAVRPLST